MSKFEDYRLLALEKLRIAEISLDENMYNSCMENCHFSVELIMKSALYKAGGNPPTTSRKGHNLLEISKTKVDGVKLFHSKIRSTRNVRLLWAKIHSKWDTSMRYRDLGIGHEEMEELYRAYRGVFKWIQNNYVD